MAASFNPELFPLGVPLTDDPHDLVNCMTGFCHHVAWALSERTGLPLAAIVDPSLGGGADRYGRFRHACVVEDSPEGRFLIDAEGRRPLAEFMRDQLSYLRDEWESNGVLDEWDEAATEEYLALVVDGDFAIRDWIISMSEFGEPLWFFDPSDPEDENLQGALELVDHYLAARALRPELSSSDAPAAQLPQQATPIPTPALEL
jgi:hypothetical protein